MKSKGLWVVIIVGLIAVAAYYYMRTPGAPDIVVTEDGQGVEVTPEMQATFGVTIAENAQTSQLVDVVGGNSTGVATRVFENGVFAHAVLADLPEPTGNTFYEGWLVRGDKGDDNFAFVSTGQMRQAKGGYVLEFEATTNYSDYNGVVITQETTLDEVPEEHVLEGSF
jgi:hypothetical protein